MRRVANRRLVGSVARPRIPLGDEVARLSLLIVAVVLSAPCEADTIVIDHVSVVDVRAGRLLEDQRVVIEGERIARVEPVNEAMPAGAVRIIDGRGKYLLPGLFDSHVHYISTETFGPMLIAHGVTFVRDLGAQTETILALRDRLNRGEVDGPEMIATGAVVDGNPPTWPFSEVCKTADDAREAVRKLAEAGVDQIKVYSNLPLDAYKAAVDEARKKGLAAVGHVPFAVTLDDAIEAGQATIEHLEGFDDLIARAAGVEVSLPRSYRSAFARWRLYSKADKAKLRETYNRMRIAGVAICPTLVVMQGIGKTGDTDADDPWLEYVPSSLQGMWKRGMYKRMSPGAKRTVPLMQQVVLELHKAGVKLLCGTDLANPNVIPGYSLHDEMRLFQEAGVPAADVLRSATIIPAEVFGVANRLGTVEQGKTASLVLVDANPLADVRNARKIDAVFVRGQHFDRKALAELLEEAKRSAHATRNPPETAEVELSLPGDVIMRGRYGSKFGTTDAGTEDFLITTTPEGYSIMARSQPKGGPQPPAMGTIHLSKTFGLRAATWKTLRGDPLEVAYTLEGNTMVATAKKKGEEPSEQRLELPESWSFNGPFSAFEFASPVMRDLSVGEKTTYTAIRFGSPSGRLGVTEVQAQRHEDRPVTLASGKSFEARYYTSEFTITIGKFTTETWTDQQGMTVKSTVKMPFGAVTVELKE